MTGATHFSHDQQRRLEAEDCDSIRCAQLISGGRRRIRPPCTVPRSRSPTMRCIRLVIIGASVSEPHTNGVAGAEMRNIFGASVSEPYTNGVAGAEMRILYIYLSYVKEAPGVQIRHVRRRHANTHCIIRGARVLRHRPHQPANRWYCGCGERHGSQLALPVVIDCHPILWRRWSPG